MQIKEIDFFNQKTREQLDQELAGGFYFNPEKIKEWNQWRLALEKFLKENPRLNQEDK